MEQARQLIDRIQVTYNELVNNGRVEVYGSPSFEVRELSGTRLAMFVGGNKIVVDPACDKLSDNSLKYIVAHEIAHFSIRRHTPKFWYIVGILYPNYEVEHNNLIKIVDNKELTNDSTRD